MGKMSGSELIRTTAGSADKPMNLTKDVIEAMAHMVIKYVAGGHAVVIPGLGKFYPKDLPARTGRNPQTGEAMDVQAKRVLAFKPLSVNKDLK